MLSNNSWLYAMKSYSYEWINIQWSHEVLYLRMCNHECIDVEFSSVIVDLVKLLSGTLSCDQQHLKKKKKYTRKIQGKHFIEILEIYYTTIQSIWPSMYVRENNVYKILVEEIQVSANVWYFIKQFILQVSLQLIDFSSCDILKNTLPI